MAAAATLDESGSHARSRNPLSADGALTQNERLTLDFEENKQFQVETFQGLQKGS
jgi:hypothetical protein